MGGRGTNQYRIFAFGSRVAVATALAVAVAPAGEATSSTCRAANLTSGTGQSQNLQRLIDSASPGDEIRVKGVCVGNLLVSIRRRFL